jgi:hypothetical protein
MAQLREIRVQIDASEAIRNETLMGREYLVLPVVALQEGVLQGANAEKPEFVPARVFEKFPSAWNNRPIVMNHPKIQGVFVSANSPDVLQDWAFGYIFNSRVEDKKLKQEAWIDVARAKELGGDFQEVIDRANAGDIIEISTGLFVDVVTQYGTYEGKTYYNVWDDNLIPDHLAMLSKGVQGACSVEDGCGAPRLNSAAEMRLVEPESEPLNNQHAEGECHCGGTCDPCKQKVQAMSMADANVTKTKIKKLSAMERLEVLLSGDVEPKASRALEDLPNIFGLEGRLTSNSVPSDVLFSDVYNLLNQALKSYRSGSMYCYLLDATESQLIYREYDDEWVGATYSVP